MTTPMTPQAFAGHVIPRMRRAWPRSEPLSPQDAAYWSAQLTADLAVPLTLEETLAAVDELARAPAGPRGSFPPGSPGELRAAALALRHRVAPTPDPSRPGPEPYVSAERARAWGSVIRDLLPTSAGGKGSLRWDRDRDPHGESLRRLVDRREASACVREPGEDG